MYYSRVSRSRIQPSMLMFVQHDNEPVYLLASIPLNKYFIKYDMNSEIGVFDLLLLLDLPDLLHFITFIRISLSFLFFFSSSLERFSSLASLQDH